MSGTDTIAWTPRHVQALRQAQFTPARHGYRRDDVERYLDHVEVLMRRGRAVRPPSAGTFRRSLFAPAYDVHRVDALTAAVQEWQAQAGAPAAAPSPATPRRSQREPLRWTHQQQDWVRESQFPAGTGGRAYDREEVDSFLDEVLAAMTKGEPLPDATSALFHTKGLGRSGYAVEAVDDFLDDLAALRPAD